MVRGGAKLRAYRGVALHYAFVGRRFSLEILKALQRDANAPQLMPRGRRDARTSLFTVTFTMHTFVGLTQPNGNIALVRDFRNVRRSVRLNTGVSSKR